jgi:hypothetical protein
MKELFLLLCVLMSNVSLFAQDVSVYISAYPEDWQLYMNPNAYNSLKVSGDKVVFLNITSNDKGSGVDTDYYAANEEGCMRAIRFMSNTFASGAGLGDNMEPLSININEHVIQKYSYRNAAIYFLRLPCSMPDGKGYANTQHQSLESFYKGQIESISAIDGGAEYSSLEDLINTIEQIITIESKDAELISFHMIDSDVSVDPDLYSDQIYSTTICNAIAVDMDRSSIFLYDSHNTESKDVNLDDKGIMYNYGTWGASCSGVGDMGEIMQWGELNTSWLRRQYFRQVKVSISQNLALNKPTESKSSEPNSGSDKAVDNNHSSWWGASPFPQWWIVDLQDEYELERLKVVNYYQDSRYYQYKIYASSDKTNWKEIVDFSDNTKIATQTGETFLLENTSARYLKVDMLYNSKNVGVHLVEFKAFGKLITNVDNGKIKSQECVLSAPNPVRLGAPVTLNLGDKVNGRVKVCANDLCGRLLFSKVLDVNMGQMKVPTHQLNSGIVILSIKYQGKFVHSKLLVE